MPGSLLRVFRSLWKIYYIDSATFLGFLRVWGRSMDRSPPVCQDPQKLLAMSFKPHPPSLPPSREPKFVKSPFWQKETIEDCLAFGCNGTTWAHLPEIRCFTSSEWQYHLFSPHEDNCLPETCRGETFLSLEHSFTIRRKHFSVFLNYKLILAFSKTPPGPIKTSMATSIVILVTNYNLRFFCCC